MQIVINDKKIDFSLENEKNAGSVVKALSEWIYRQNFYINKIEINSTEYDLTDTERYSNIPLAEINDINIKTMSILELRYSQLEVIIVYFSNLVQMIDSSGNENIFEYLQEYSDIKMLLESAVDKVYNSGNQGFIETFLLEKDLSVKSLKQLRDFSESIIFVAESRKREITSTKEEILHEQEMFKSILPEMGNISILLQTGKDREAMEKVLMFIDFSKKLLRLLSYYSFQNKDTIEPESINRFNTLLTELFNAISRSDSVLTGDLLEYELAPAIENFFCIIGE